MKEIPLATSPFASFFDVSLQNPASSAVTFLMRNPQVSFSHASKLWMFSNAHEYNEQTMSVHSIDVIILIDN